jgi:hypothetical protein
MSALVVARVPREDVPTRQVRRAAQRRAVRALRQRQTAQGLTPRATATIANGTSAWATVAEEREARQEAIDEQVTIYRAVLPQLLERLGQIPDPRHAKTVRHTATALLLYGMLTFVFQMASRREANRQMTMPMFREHLQLLFPEVETLPHHDTLYRLLSVIEVDQIETSMLSVVARFLRQKKFTRHQIADRYPIAIDGTQKLVRNTCWDGQCLERQVSSTAADGTVTKRPQYYVYVLEATLAFANGLTIPLMSEFLSYTEGDPVRNKQDCELKAFTRLSARLKARFPRLPILVLLDGLYANGPVMARCRQYHWQFMIVLQNGSLPSVWEEVVGLKALQPHHQTDRTWGDRTQHFWWVNAIDYAYGEHERHHQTVHVVICEEHWDTVDAATATIVVQRSRHAWLSSAPLTRDTVHARCNLGARHRWGIESHFLVEKKHGYEYEHGFSQNWQAMKGYHFLMRLGHLINILASRTARLAQLVGRLGVRGLIRFLRDTCSGPWLDPAHIRALRALPCGQIRLE